MIKISDNIVLYHGSDVIVKRPLLSKCNEGKDFGRGFYLTTDYDQALKFAKLISYRNKTETPIVNTYRFKEITKLNKHIFENLDREWINYVVDNRTLTNKIKSYEKYDIITGKIADDDTSKKINAYLVGAYGEVGSKEALDDLIKNLKPEKLNNQVCFKTNKSLSCLEFLNAEEV